MYPQFNKGILKLLPKKVDKRHIRDWRPMAMLSTAYKIIAKLIRLQLRMLLPNLVMSDKLDSSHGDILENISNTWLAFDRILQDGISALFLRLDFEKAFDKVDFNYIWAMLTTMGLGKFLTLMKGLIIGGSIKIYTNGQFFEPIPIEWGVRQSCPLAPTLFALYTWPLLALMQAERSQGQLMGVKLEESFYICKCLFTDDLGILIPAMENAF